MTATLQRSFDPRALDKGTGSGHALRRPVLPLVTASDVLDLSEADVMAEIGERRIRWAFNLSAGDERASCVLVLTRSLVCWFAERDNVKLEQPRTIEDVITAILPPASLLTGVIRGAEFRQLFRVGKNHVNALLAAGLLQERKRPGHAARSGINGSRLLTRASVMELLKLRQAPW